MRVRAATGSQDLRKLTKFLDEWKEEKLNKVRNNDTTGVFTVPVASCTSSSNMEKAAEEINCLYACQKYLLNFCMFFGVVPVKVHVVDGKCVCKHHWASKPSFINLILLLVFIGSIAPVYWNTQAYASTIFGKTDYFFQVNSSLFRSGLTITIFVANNWRADTFAKGKYIRSLYKRYTKSN